VSDEYLARLELRIGIDLALDQIEVVRGQPALRLAAQAPLSVLHAHSFLPGGVLMPRVVRYQLNLKSTPYSSGVPRLAIENAGANTAF
jgi:hypothetical protein